MQFSYYLKSWPFPEKPGYSLLLSTKKASLAIVPEDVIVQLTQGVINIITKDPAASSQPTGMISASYGEQASQEYQGELTGKAGRFGYFLYAGRQDSDGLKGNRFFENNSFYAKLDIDLPKQMELTLSLGASGPEFKEGDFWELDFSSIVESSDRFATATFDMPLTDNLFFNLSLRTISKEFDQFQPLLGTGLYGGPAGEPNFSQYNDESSYGGSGRLVWKGEEHTAVLGVEYDRGKLDRSFYYGPNNWGPFLDIADTAREERLAIYLNDTISLGKLTLVPGIRYDIHSITKEFVSPSLGATYRISDQTLLRSTISRGFNSPFLSLVSGASQWTSVNPDLDPLTVISYQAGVESTALKWLRTKANLFQHEVDDAWLWDDTNWYYINGGTSQRRGIELEVQTVSFHHLSLNTNFTYAHIHTPLSIPDYEEKAANLILNYDNPKVGKAQLSGHFIYSSVYDNDNYPNGKFDTIWDLNLSKALFSTRFSDVEMFCTIRNLFNGSQYWTMEYGNPNRWIEGGLRFLL